MGSFLFEQDNAEKCNQAGVVSTIVPVRAASAIASVMRRFCRPSRARTIGDRFDFPSNHAPEVFDLMR